MPATMGASAQARNSNAQAGAPPAPLIPFTGAAHEHVEPAFQFNVTPSVNQQVFGPFDVPAFGFLRHLVIEVTTSGAGTIGPGVVSADYPFAIFDAISLSDVNGAPLYGPYTGYETLWANIAGGYVYKQDPRVLPNYSAAGATPSFIFRIPIEISHFDGLGSIANQNAASSYKVSLTISTIATQWGTAPTTPPTMLIRGWLEAWTLPNNVDIMGRPQAQFPPAHGTTQYWSKFTKAINAGNNSLLLPRVGNLVRNIVLIARSSAGGTPRDDTVFPDPLRLTWDQRDLYNASRNLLIQYMAERIEQLTARDTGVLHLSFNHPTQGRTGDGPPNLWLPTMQSSRLEITGVSGTAGSITVLTNDVAPAEVNPAERFVETSQSGGRPGGGGGAYPVGAN